MSKINLSIRNVKWIGRMEVMKKYPYVVIDGAHNIQGITALTYSIDKYIKYKKMILLLGILADKKVDSMTAKIVPKAKKVYALTPHSERAELAGDLKKVVLKYNSNCISYESYEEAYNNALKEADEDDLILICGSLYMIGDMRKIIRKNR